MINLYNHVQETLMLRTSLLAATYISVAMLSVVSQAESPLSSTIADDAQVWIVSPKDQTQVSSPVTIVFGSSNLNIAPAGNNQPNSGHHHLLVDMEELPALDMPLPASDQVIHFGKGQTETTIELSSGSHSLQLLLGNYAHVPHSRPVISEKITIVVE
jgi:hypothetical protein